MGSEQSTEGGQQKEKASRLGQLKRGKSVPERKSKRDDSADGEFSRPGSCSPVLSACSDSELPYISYTLNRPIGDSPKHLGAVGGSGKGGGGLLLRGRTTGRKGSSGGRKASGGPTRPQHSVVVVKPPTQESPTQQDPDLLRLQNIPQFLPIMRGTLKVPAAKDLEVLERLDPRPLHRLCLRTQRHITQSALTIANEQDRLNQRIKQMEVEVSQLLSAYVQRERTYAKHAEALSKVSELTSQISKCHLVLNKTLDSLEQLSNLLPPEERLEPFVWTTG